VYNVNGKEEDEEEEEDDDDKIEDSEDDNDDVNDDSDGRFDTGIGTGSIVDNNEVEKIQGGSTVAGTAGIDESDGSCGTAIDDSVGAAYSIVNDKDEDDFGIVGVDK
jgi:hypothetical protein